MLFVRIGLVLAAITAPAIAMSAWSGGFPAEVAVLRGCVGAAAVLAVAYVAELLVATAPPPGGFHVERLPRAGSDAPHDDDSTAEVV